MCKFETLRKFKMRLKSCFLNTTKNANFWRREFISVEFNKSCQSAIFANLKHLLEFAIIKFR